MAENPEEVNLPASVVMKIVKEAIPDNVKVSREASAAIARAASVFVLYTTSCVGSVAAKANRKTLQGSDVIQAMEDMEFDRFVNPLEISLEEWKQSQAKKKEQTAKRKKEKESKTPEKTKPPASSASESLPDDQTTVGSDEPEVMECSPPAGQSDSNKENND